MTIPRGAEVEATARARSVACAAAFPAALVRMRASAIMVALTTHVPASTAGLAVPSTAAVPPSAGHANGICSSELVILRGQICRRGNTSCMTDMKQVGN